MTARVPLVSRLTYRPDVARAGRLAIGILVFFAV
jgi:hypothetical protein